MIGYASIFIDRQTNDLHIVPVYVTSIGYGTYLGVFEQVEYENLLEKTEEMIKKALDCYKMEPNKNKKDNIFQKYKTWKQVFKRTNVITITYFEDKQKIQFQLVRKG